MSKAKKIIDILTESRLPTVIETPGKQNVEAFYVVSKEGEIMFGPFELTPKGRKMANKVKEKGSMTLMFHLPTGSNKFKWSLPNKDS